MKVDNDFVEVLNNELAEFYVKNEPPINKINWIKENVKRAEIAATFDTKQ